MAMATNPFFTHKTLILPLPRQSIFQNFTLPQSLCLNSGTQIPIRRAPSCARADLSVRVALDGDYSSKRSSSNEQRETIMLPGCDYNRWVIVNGVPQRPCPYQRADDRHYLNALATVLGSMDEAKNMSCMLLAQLHALDSSALHRKKHLRNLKVINTSRRDNSLQISRL